MTPPVIPPVPHVAALEPYALADLGAGAHPAPVSLAQNESLRPPSPRARAAAGQAAHLYPDPDWTALRHALGDLHGIDPACILCGNGSLDLIGAIARAYAGPADAVLAPAHAYPFFGTATRMTGARFDRAPETDLTVSVAALLEAVTPETRIVFVANPGNPTGTRIARADLVSLRAGLPGDVLLVIDEAYGEFADHLGEPVFDLVARGDTVVLRTFSKAYGLAGMRVGWGLFPEAVAAEVRKLLNPNNIAAASQAAAIAALGDQAYMRETCRITAELCAAFAGRLGRAGLAVADSHTNFVLIRFATTAGAGAADRALRAAGLVARAQSGAGLAHALRITMAPASALERAARVLETFAQGDTP